MMRGHKARSARAIIRTGQEVVNVAQEEEETVGRVIRQGRRELRKGVVKVVRHAWHNCACRLAKEDLNVMIELVSTCGNQNQINAENEADKVFRPIK